MDGDSDIVSLVISNLLFVVLFALSEYLGESSCPENGVLRMVSRRVFCLGGRRVRFDVSIANSEAGDEVSEETPLNPNVNV